jgi:hypothetical protein
MLGDFETPVPPSMGGEGGQMGGLPLDSEMCIHSSLERERDFESGPPSPFLGEGDGG